MACARAQTDLLLVFPPGLLKTSDRFDYHLGSACVGAYLNASGLTAVPFLTEGPIGVQELVRRVARLRPRAVGFTVYNANYLACALLARALKAADGRLVILFGGPLPTFLSREVLRHNPWVDIAFRGMGEEACRQVLERLGARGDGGRPLEDSGLSEVPGITFRSEDGEIVSTPDGAVPGKGPSSAFSLDAYPSPYLSGWIPVREAFRTGLVTARGCNQPCTYCNCAVLWKKKILPHSVDRVLGELQMLSDGDYPAAPVQLWDDAFNLLPRRAERICLGILENRIRLPLACLVRADRVDETFLRLLKEAGFVGLSFSLESAVPRVLRVIGKVASPRTRGDPDFRQEADFVEKVAHCTNLAKKIGFESTAISIMVGLPGEEPGDAETTLSFLETLQAEEHIQNVFTIYPGTPVSADHARHGFELRPLNRSGLLLETVHPRPLPGQGKGHHRHFNRRLAIEQGMRTAEILALAVGRERDRTAFRNVILLADRVTGPFLEWIRANLTMTGQFLHIRGENARAPAGPEMTRILHDAFSPTLDYTALVREGGAGGPDWGGRLRFQALNQVDMTDWCIARRGAGELLSGPRPAPAPGEITVCAVRSRRDGEALTAFFRHVASSPDAALELSRWSSGFYVEQLCRWRLRGANCQEAETAIVDGAGRVRLCWHADPVGTLDDNHETLREKAARLASQRTGHRPCGSCPVTDACTRCAFPRPFSEEGYCDVRRSLRTTPVTEFLALQSRNVAVPIR